MTVQYLRPGRGKRSVFRVWRQLSRDSETEWTFTAVVTGLYLAGLIWLHVHHEPWRDEMHPWIVAKRAQGFWDIVTGDRVYDGHPPLWYWYLRMWTWLTHRPWGLHAANIAVMTAAAGILLRWAPLPRWTKVGLLTCSQITFDYAVMSRNYSLGILLTFIFCARFHPLRPRFVSQSLLLGLLCLSSVYGVIMAASLFVVLLPWGVRLALPGPPHDVGITVARRWLVGAALLLALAVFTAYTISPPGANPASPSFDIATVLSAAPWVRFGKRVVATFFPLRHYAYAEYWGNVWAFWGDHQNVLAAVAVILFLGLVLSLGWAWSQAALLLGLGLMGFVQITRYEGGPRHWGHALILYLALLWLSRRVWPRRAFHLALGVLIVTIAFQLQSFSASVIRDRIDQFSGGPELAAYVEGHNLERLPLVAGPEAFVISAAGHLGRTFESVETEEVNETMMFHDRRRAFDPAALVARAVAVGARKHSAVLLLSNQALPYPTAAGVQSLLLFQNSQPSPHDENFKLYQVWSESWRRP